MHSLQVVVMIFSHPRTRSYDANLYNAVQQEAPKITTPQPRRVIKEHAYCISLSDATAIIFSLHVSVWLLFKGGIYFFGEPANINNGWIWYV